MKQESTKPKLSVRALYVWSIANITLGVAVVLFIRYQWTVTPCRNNGCDTLQNVAGVAQPLAMLIFLVGLVLLTSATVRYFLLRRKR